MVKKFCGNIKNLFVMELLFKFIDSLSSHQVREFDLQEREREKEKKHRLVLILLFILCFVLVAC
jgi:hypothetical protein